MDNQDRQAIEGLFARLREVERQAGPRDHEAENFIRERMAQQPGAPYYMAQTIVMQDYALQEAQRRIEELEREASRRTGRLLTGVFGGDQPSRGSVPSVPCSAAGQEDLGTAPPAEKRQSGHGSFLGGAVQTALGVTGGMLLGAAIGSLFGGIATQAAEVPPAAAPEHAANDEGGGFFDGFFGDLFGGDEGP